MKLHLKLFRLAFLLCAAAAAVAHADTGTVVGRISSPATGENLRFAEVHVVGTKLTVYSDADGSYILSNVPAGEATLTVTYTGFTTGTEVVLVTADQTVRRDISLGGGNPAREGPIMLQKFTVSATTAGNAKALMDERAALNVQNVIAADTHGEVIGGNIGEFVKYLPGVVLDYTEGDARAARISGLDPKFTGVTIDGMQMASAQSGSFGTNSRQFEFEEASITSIDSFEVSKTLNASMQASSPAGVINLVSKNAFDLTSHILEAELDATADSYSMTLHGTPTFNEKNQTKVFPGGTFGYANSFGGRLGVYVSLGNFNSWNPQGLETNTYTLGASGPQLTKIMFKDGPTENHRYSAALNVDYKVNDHLSVSLRNTGSRLNNEFINQNMFFDVSNLAAGSSATHVVAQPNGSSTNLEETLSHRLKINDTATETLRLDYKLGDFEVIGGAGTSRSDTNFEEGAEANFFQGITQFMDPIGFQADRPSPSSNAWTLTQTSGLPWNQASSFGRGFTSANNISNTLQHSDDTVNSAYVDIRKTLAVAGQPIDFQAGWKSQVQEYDLLQNGANQWTFVGPTGNQLDPSTVIPANTNQRFDALQGGNLASLDIPFSDAIRTWSLYAQNPSWFTPNLTGNETTKVSGPRGVREQIDAGYFMATTRVGKLRLNLGLRNERTRTIAYTQNEIADGVIAATQPGLTKGTIPYIDYQFQNGRLFPHYGEYDNWFLSGGAKYTIFKNLDFQVAGSQSILRPDFQNLAGVVSINDTTNTITLPNPNNAPATSNKYYAELRYFIEPAGTISIDVYDLQNKNIGTQNLATAAPPQYANDPLYNGFTFLQTTTAAGIQKVKGVDLEYNQQLVFLPGILHGLSVFGSVSRTPSSVQVGSLISKSANGGVGFSSPRFHAELRSTWTSAWLATVTPGAPQTDIWANERIMFDASAGFKLTSNYELVLNGRNILNSPLSEYEGAPGLLVQREYLGSLWTFGIRGRF